MKFKNFFLVSVVALCSIACSKEEVPKLTAFVGHYEGNSLASCAYFQNSYVAGETVSIAENSDGTASVTFASHSWGEFSIPCAQTSIKDGTCTITGNGQTEMGMNGNTSSYNCTYTATIRNKEDFEMKFEVPGVMGGLSITLSPGNEPSSAGK